MTTIASTHPSPRLPIGLVVPYTDAVPRRHLVEVVEVADRLGYESAWVPEAYGYDAFTLLAVLATRTSSIQLGTGIVNVFSRTPALLAQTIASLDELSGGRAILGLGTSGPQVVSGWHGVPFDRPLRRLRETVDIVRLVLRRERLVYDGEVFQLRGGLKLITHPPRAAIPIAVASITDGGVRLAAEIADRWMPTLWDPDAAPAVFAEALREGAARRPSWLDPLVCSPSVTVSADDDLGRARDRVRPHLALYIGGMGTREKNFYNALVARYGFAAEALRIQDLYLGGRRAEAVAAVPDALVDRLAVLGPEDRCAERIGEFVARGLVPLVSLSVPEDGDEAQRRRLILLERLADAAAAVAR